MQPLVSNRMAFLKALEAQKKPKLNKKIKKYIDSWVSRNYELLIERISWNCNVIVNGLNAFDKFQNALVGIYHNPDIAFSDQFDCDEYMDNYFIPNRFINKLNTPFANDREILINGMLRGGAWNPVIFVVK